MKRLRILHLEDNDGDARLIQALVQRKGVECEFTRVLGRRDFCLALEKMGAFDLILADFNLPQFDGLSALKLAVVACPEVPFILVSGAIGEETAVAALKAGATDYVIKDRMERLPAAILRAVEEAENRRRQRLAEAEVQRQQELLRQAQKMEAVGRLAGGIAHDFNNLLTAIIGYSQLLRDRIPPDPETDGYLDVLKQVYDRGTKLTRQLLTFSRKQPFQPATVDLNQAVRDLTQLLCRTMIDKIRVEMTLDATAGSITIDPSHLDQILMNLCVNARDAMPAGGQLRLSTAPVELTEALCAGHPGLVPGPGVLLTVSDSGCGMNAETMSHIFEPFFTTKGAGKGTGLGLSIVYGLMEQNHGAIEVTSTAGQGTEFRLYFPAGAQTTKPA